MRRRLVALLVGFTLLLLPLPADAGIVTINPPGIFCSIGKVVALRFTVAAGSSTVTNRSNRVGTSNNTIDSSPVADWYTPSQSLNIPAGWSYTVRTNYRKVFSTNTLGNLSWITLKSPVGQPAPTFSWIGWVCV